MPCATTVCTAHHAVPTPRTSFALAFAIFARPAFPAQMPCTSTLPALTRPAAFATSFCRHLTSHCPNLHWCRLATFTHRHSRAPCHAVGRQVPFHLQRNVTPALRRLEFEGLQQRQRAALHQPLKHHVLKHRIRDEALHSGNTRSERAPPVLQRASFPLEFQHVSKTRMFQRPKALAQPDPGSYSVQLLGPLTDHLLGHSLRALQQQVVQHHVGVLGNLAQLYLRHQAAHVLARHLLRLLNNLRHGLCHTLDLLHFHCQLRHPQRRLQLLAPLTPSALGRAKDRYAGEHHFSFQNCCYCKCLTICNKALLPCKSNRSQASVYYNMCIERSANIQS